MANEQLIAAYHAARGDYEGATSGNRAEMFTKFLVAERILFVRLDRLIRTCSTSWTVIHLERVARARPRCQKRMPPDSILPISAEEGTTLCAI